MPQTSQQSQMWIAKSKRNGMIVAVEWMRSRHQDELALGLATTLTAPQYTQLLQYIQALRACMDPGITDPTKVVWPAKPPFVS